MVKNSKDIRSKHAEFLNAARVTVSYDNREIISKETARKEGILISAIMRKVGLGSLTSEEIEDYTSEGLVRREILIEDALRALPMIAISSHKSSLLLENSLNAQAKTNSED